LLVERSFTSRVHSLLRRTNLQQRHLQPAQAEAPHPVLPQPTSPLQSQRTKARQTSQVATKQAASESQTVIENGLYKITFSNRGAQVKSWILKKYTDDKGQPLELVHSVAAPQFGYPLSLYTYDPALTKKLNEALYVSNGSSSLAAPATITFEYADLDVTVSKKFTFDHSYVVHIETR